MRASVWAGAAAAFAVALNANAAPPHPNVKLLDAVKACEKDARALMEQAVAIDSGTGDAEGLAAMGALFGVRFKALGAEVKSIAPTPSAVGDASLAAQAGAPTLDGFAMEGDGAQAWMIPPTSRP